MKLLIFFLVALPLSLHGQVRVSLRTGYGMYAMKEMKSLQANLARQADYPMRATERFPGYAYYEASLMFPLGNQLFCAANFGYGSTGGRVHYGDYSGEFRFDQLLNYMSAGGSVGISTGSSTGQYIFDFTLSPSVALTNLDMEFLARIGNERSVERINFRSTNFGLQPDIALTRKLGRFGVQLMLGYHFGIVRGKMFLTGDSQAYLIDSSGNRIPANWDGARAAVGISYFFRDANISN